MRGLYFHDSSLLAAMKRGRDAWRGRRGAPGPERWHDGMRKAGDGDDP